VTSLCASAGGKEELDVRSGTPFANPSWPHICSILHDVVGGMYDAISIRSGRRCSRLTLLYRSDKPIRKSVEVLRQASYIYSGMSRELDLEYITYGGNLAPILMSTSAVGPII
jgi:hypothetical protein